ncbi:MAG: YceI family protein [Cyclobacteriaceae bacterium]
MKLLPSVLLIFTFVVTHAQKYKSEQSSITFFSEAAIENIAATNSSATSLFNAETGEIAFLVQMDGFEFEKSLMQQHFNEKYMETHKFPTASFKGKIIGFEKALNGKPRVKATGQFTIHGQSKAMEVEGFLTIDNREIIMSSSFMIELADYKIKIPKLLWQNIAERVEVKIKFIYKPL